MNYGYEDGDDNYRGDYDCDAKCLYQEENAEDLDEYYRILEVTLDVDNMLEYILRKEDLKKHFPLDLIVDYYDDLWRQNKSRKEMFEFFNTHFHELKHA